MFSVAADYEAVPQFLVGMRLDWFSTGTDMAQLKAGTTMGNIQYSVSAMPVYATTTFHQPLGGAWSLGFSAGFGVPLFFHESLEVTGSNIATLPNGSAVYAANPFSGFGLTYMNVELSRRVSLHTEAGYRFMSSSQLTLMDNYAKVKAGTIFTDSNNVNVAVDAGSFFLGASAVIGL